MSRSSVCRKTISALVVAPRRTRPQHRQRPEPDHRSLQFAHYAALCEGRSTKIELSKTTISLVVVCEVQLAFVLLHQLLEAVQPGDFTRAQYARPLCASSRPGRATHRPASYPGEWMLGSRPYHAPLMYIYSTARIYIHQPAPGRTGRLSPLASH